MVKRAGRGGMWWGVRVGACFGPLSLGACSRWPNRHTHTHGGIHKWAWARPTTRLEVGGGGSAVRTHHGHGHGEGAGRVRQSSGVVAAGVGEVQPQQQPLTGPQVVRLAKPDAHGLPWWWCVWEGGGRGRQHRDTTARRWLQDAMDPRVCECERPWQARTSWVADCSPKVAARSAHAHHPPGTRARP